LILQTDNYKKQTNKPQSKHYRSACDEGNEFSTVVVDRCVTTVGHKQWGNLTQWQGDHYGHIPACNGPLLLAD